MPDDAPLPWIPILMYHRVVPTIANDDPFGNCITASSFEGHLRWLRSLKYTSVSLDQIADPELARSLPRRPIAITFDDGYEDTHDYAWPLLRQYGFHATIFVVSGAIGSDNEFDRTNVSERVRMVTAVQIQKMHRGGMAIGSHTRTHPAHLADLPHSRAEDEIRLSRCEIENIVQAPVRHFAYPYARFHARLARIVQDADYSSASAGVGTEFSRFRLSRIFVSHPHGAGLFVQMGARRSKHLMHRMASRAGGSVARRLR